MSARQVALVRLAVIALVLRLAYLLEHSGSPFFGYPFLDEAYYDQLARLFAGGGGAGHFAGFRPVLYPLFLSVFYRAGGSYGVSLALLAQHALGVLTAVLIAVIAARLFRSFAAGWLAGLLYALGAPPLFLEGELLIESFYVFLITLALFAHTTACRRSTAARWLACGALIGIAGQAHAKVLAFAAFYPLCAAWLARRAAPAAARPLWGLAGVFTVLALAGAWSAGQTGTFQLVPGYGGINLYLGNRRGADGMVPRQDAWTTYHGDVYEDSIDVYARQEYEKAMRAEGRAADPRPAAVSAYWARRALAEVSADPGRWLALIARKAWLLLWSFEVPNNKSFSFFVEHESWILRLLPVRWFVLLALAPIGVAAARRSGDRTLLALLLAFLAVYSAVIVLFFVNGRYRLSLWPATAALAGGGLWECARAWRERRTRHVAACAAAAAVVAAVSLAGPPGVARPTFARDFWARSLAWYARGDAAHALEDVQQSLRLEPGNYKAMLHLGNVLFVLERYAEARRVFLEVTGGDPREPRGWNNLGSAHEALGDAALARRAYESALGVDPADRTALQNLTVLDLRTGDRAGAERRLAALEAADPGNAVALAVRSVLRRRDGDAAAADALAARANARDASAAAWALGKLATP